VCRARQSRYHEPRLLGMLLQRPSSAATAKLGNAVARRRTEGLPPVGCPCPGDVDAHSGRRCGSAANNAEALVLALAHDVGQHVEALAVAQHF
jgi:hypothetical protein